MKPRVVNFVGGPSVGKSNIATDLFAKLKFEGVNTEYVPEYAKWLVWEGRTGKVYADQGYIFAKQSWHLKRVAEEVAVTVTDACLLNTLVYTPVDYPMKEELKQLAISTYNRYDNLNILLRRAKPYHQAGRTQDEEEAKKLDTEILNMLIDCRTEIHVMDWSREAADKVIKIMQAKGWV